MALPQDAAQTAQASNIIAEREYQAAAIQYEKDKKQYESDLKIYNENLAKEKAAAEADAKAAADALAASKKYYAETAPPTKWIVRRGGTRYENPAYTAYVANRPEVVAARAAQSPEANAKQDFLNQYVKSHPYAKGTEINRAVSKFESTQLKGMSESDWNAYVKAEDANRALALKQSAGLRASGNAQITSAQTAELARLGGTATSGPTMVSGNISQNRVPVAVDPITGKPSVAAVAQPWGPGFVPTPPVAPSTPESRWAEIATPGVGMFSGIGQKPSTPSAAPVASSFLSNRKVETKPLTNAEKRWAERTGGILTAEQQSKKASDAFAELNRPQEVSRSTPWVVGDKGFFSKGAAERSGGIMTGGLVETVPAGTVWNLVGADGKNLKNSQGKELQFKTAESADRYSKILSQQGNTLGYSKSGQPLQGPVKAEPSPQFITVPTLGGKNQSVDVSGTNYIVDGRIFPNEKEADNYINNPPVNLKGEAKLRYDISQSLDKASQYRSGSPIIDTAYSAIVGHPLGTVRSIVEGVNVLDNLGKYTIPGLIGTKPFSGTPIPVQRTGDEVLLPVEISETGIRQKSLGEIKSDSIEYARKHSVGDLMGGAISTYVPIGMGVKAGITTVGKFAAKRVAPKLISIATSERNLIGSTSTVRKVPATINPRKPVINKETLYTNIQSRQQGISGNPKLLAPYSQPKNPSLGTGVIPKESIKGSIKFSPDFIPNKPERPFVPLDTKRPVGIDPTYTPARRANEIDYTDSVIYGFRSKKLNLGQGVTKDRIGVMKTKAPFKPEPVKGDPMYKPSRRTNEIKMEDGYQIGFTESKVRLGASQVRTPKPKGVTDFADRQFRGFQKSATVIGKIKLSKDFVPSKIRPAETKNLDFANPWRIKPRKFDEPKTGKGDRLVGKDGSIQIVKSKSEVVKLKKPQPTPVKIVSKQESATEGVQKAGSVRPIVVLVKPAGRLITKKRKPVEARTVQASQDYSEVTYQRTSAPQRVSNIVSARSMTSARLTTRVSAKLAVKTSPRLATRITPIIAQKQPQALKQSEAQKFRTPAPDPVRPKLRAAPKFRLKQPTRTVMREVPREPPRTKAVPIILPPIDDKKGKRKTKNNKENDFLGNTRLGNIEGLFRRSDIIHGDKKIEKQIRKDKKSKFKERGVSFFSRR